MLVDEGEEVYGAGGGEPSAIEGVARGVGTYRPPTGRSEPSSR